MEEKLRQMEEKLRQIAELEYRFKKELNKLLYEHEIACRAYLKKHVTEEIMKVVFHPHNLHRMKDLGFEEEDDDEYFDF